MKGRLFLVLKCLCKNFESYENDSTIMLGEEMMEMDLGLEDNIPIMMIEKKMAQMGLEEQTPVYKLWEKEANEWLSGYSKNKKLRITQNLGKFGFGEEILAHQELESHLIREKIKTHHILDYFDTKLVTPDCNLISPIVDVLGSCHPPTSGLPRNCFCPLDPVQLEKLDYSLG